MYIQSEKLERIAVVAKTFDWAWTKEDLPALCESMGWDVVQRTVDGAVLRTDHMTDRPEAYWSVWSNGKIRDVIMVVTDQVDTNDSSSVERLLDEFRHLVARFTLVLGRPRESELGPEPKVRWNRASLVVRLFVLDGYINLYLVNPAYQEWLDTPDEFRIYE